MHRKQFPKTFMKAFPRKHLCMLHQLGLHEHVIVFPQFQSSSILNKWSFYRSSCTLVAKLKLKTKQQNAAEIYLLNFLARNVSFTKCGSFVRPVISHLTSPLFPLGLLQTEMRCTSFVKIRIKDSLHDNPEDTLGQFF